MTIEAGVLGLIASLCTLLGAFVGGFFLYIVTNKTLNSNTKREIMHISAEQDSEEKRLNITYITDKRVDWMSKIRDVSAEYLSLIYDVTASGIFHTIKPEIITKLNEKSTLLKLYLNFMGDIDAVIINIINDVNRDIKNKRFEEAQLKANLLINHLQIYLKLEWNRVNSEVKTGIYNSSQLRKETIELYDKFIHGNKIENYKIKEVCEILKEKYSCEKM